ncbi:hypothetical protein ABT160_44320 [Streptomyces sp. NPDC001941]|uniref:hypothetical protein n=1 Tax=Streptomyces sp. NPDC001941 TaxID=3154659 RepID=UPI00331C6DEE
MRARHTAAAAVLLLLATGCGIRTTSVPVDAGAAPSRVPCSLSGDRVATQSQGGLPVRVYLVCAAELVAVDRTAAIDVDKGVADRVRVAQALLDQLDAEPGEGEREAGFSTSLRRPLVVSAARRGDPAGTLRLSRQPEDLPAVGLAQLVCTFAESEAAATAGTVVLGGPGEYPPRAYRCSARTKSSPASPVPTAAPTASSPS